MTEVEQHVAEGGWDQPPLLFALVDTAELLRREPTLVGSLGMTPGSAPPGSLTPVQQDGLIEGPLDEVLAGIAWPPDVLGCALVSEVVVLPPSAEDEEPGEDLESWAAGHPLRREVRLAVGVLRDGGRACALRLRAADTDSGDTDSGDDILQGPDLAPRLVEALLATLA